MSAPSLETPAPGIPDEQFVRVLGRYPAQRHLLKHLRDEQARLRATGSRQSLFAIARARQLFSPEQASWILQRARDGAASPEQGTPAEATGVAATPDPPSREPASPGGTSPRRASLAEATPAPSPPASTPEIQETAIGDGPGLPEPQLVRNMPSADHLCPEFLIQAVLNLPKPVPHASLRRSKPSPARARERSPRQPSRQSAPSPPAPSPPDSSPPAPSPPAPSPPAPSPPPATAEPEPPAAAQANTTARSLSPPPPPVAEPASPSSGEPAPAQAGPAPEALGSRVEGGRPGRSAILRWLSVLALVSVLGGLGLAAQQASSRPEPQREPGPEPALASSGGEVAASSSAVATPASSASPAPASPAPASPAPASPAPASPASPSSAASALPAASVAAATTDRAPAVTPAPPPAVAAAPPSEVARRSLLEQLGQRVLLARSRPGRAAFLWELVAELEGEPEQAARARARGEELRQAAREQLEAVQAAFDAPAAAEGGQAAELLARLFALQRSCAGLGLEQELRGLERRLRDGIARQLVARQPPAREPRLEALERQGRAALVQLDVKTALTRFTQLLDQEQQPARRARAHRLLDQARALDELLQAIDASVQGGKTGNARLQVENGEARYRERREGGLVFQLGKRPHDERRDWSEVDPVLAQELLACYGPSTLEEGRVARTRAFHAFAAGLEARGLKILALAGIGFSSARAELSSLYALAADRPLPPEGFQVNGDVTHLLDDREYQEQLKALEARRWVDPDRRVTWDLELAERLEAVGRFDLARRVYDELVQRTGATELVARARARRDDPLLHRVDLRPLVGAGTNGPPGERLDIYILGDGFSLPQQGAFQGYARQAVRALRRVEPFRTFDSSLNYWVVSVRSPAEGASALGACVGAKGRYELGATQRAALRARLAQRFPGEEDGVALVVGNARAWDGGGAEGIGVVPRSLLGETPRILAQALGNLGDERDRLRAGPSPVRWRSAPNLIDDGQHGAESIPWKVWEDPTGGARWNWSREKVGTFLGGDGRGKERWRPQRRCRMRAPGADFCVVCMEAVVEAILARTPLLRAQAPPAGERVLDGPREFQLRVPARDSLRVRWTLDGQELSGQEHADLAGRVHSVLLDPGRLPGQGPWTLVGAVQESTPWVRERDETDEEDEDPRPPRRVETSWTLRRPAPPDEPAGDPP